jgi:hypothetical protein
MSPKRFVSLLVAALVAIAGAMYLSSLRHLDRDDSGKPLLPSLEASLDEITDIRLRKAESKPFATLHRQSPGHWVLAERDGYAADLGKIRRLLLALGEAKVVEGKTANPASYDILGVEDVGRPNAGGTEVTLVAPAKTTTLIVGHSAGNGNYVRRAGEAQSLLIEPPVPLDTNTRDWIDTRLLDISPEKIQRIRMRLADGGSYAIARVPPPAAAPPPAGAAKPAMAPAAEGDGFKLDAVPAGREAADPASIAPSPTTYKGVPADDVAAATGIDFSKSSVAELDLSDGSTLTLTGTVAGDKHWIKLQSSKDADLNARLQGRAFEIAGYRYDAIYRPLEQLLKPKPLKAAPATKPVPSGKRPNGHP